MYAIKLIERLYLEQSMRDKIKIFKTVITFLLRVKYTNTSLHCVLESDLDKNMPRALRCDGGGDDHQGIKSLKTTDNRYWGFLYFFTHSHKYAIPMRVEILALRLKHSK